MYIVNQEKFVSSILLGTVRAANRLNALSKLKLRAENRSIRIPKGKKLYIVSFDDDNDRINVTGWKNVLDSEAITDNTIDTTIIRKNGDCAVYDSQESKGIICGKEYAKLYISYHKSNDIKSLKFLSAKIYPYKYIKDSDKLIRSFIVFANSCEKTEIL